MEDTSYKGPSRITDDTEQLVESFKRALAAEMSALEARAKMRTQVEAKAEESAKIYVLETELSATRTNLEKEQQRSKGLKRGAVLAGTLVGTLITALSVTAAAYSDLKKALSTGDISSINVTTEAIDQKIATNSARLTKTEDEINAINSTLALINAKLDLMLVKNAETRPK